VGRTLPYSKLPASKQELRTARCCTRLASCRHVASANPRNPASARFIHQLPRATGARAPASAIYVGREHAHWQLEIQRILRRLFANSLRQLLSLFGRRAFSNPKNSLSIPFLGQAEYALAILCTRANNNQLSTPGSDYNDFPHLRPPPSRLQPLNPRKLSLAREVQRPRTAKVSTTSANPTGRL